MALYVWLIIERKGTKKGRWDIKSSGMGFLINLHPLLKLNNSITNASFEIAVKYFMGPKVDKYFKIKKALRIKGLVNRTINYCELQHSKPYGSCLL